MSGGFIANETVNTLKTIFEKHKNERVCVIGRMCCGKTTMIKRLSYNCIDMDDEFFPIDTHSVKMVENSKKDLMKKKLLYLRR